MRNVIAALVAATTTLFGLSADWVWPVDDAAPQVVREFDPPSEPWSAGHRGIDVASSPGAIVRSAGAGTVSYAGLVAGVGVVTVSHGAVRTTYQPVVPRVSVGQHLNIGDVIGVLTSAGSHCAPDSCLHWGVIRGSVYLDPMHLVTRAGPPRLLPLDAEALRPPQQPTPIHASTRGSVPTDVAALVTAGALAGLRSLAPSSVPARPPARGRLAVSGEVVPTAIAAITPQWFSADWPRFPDQSQGCQIFTAVLWVRIAAPNPEVALCVLAGNLVRVT